MEWNADRITIYVTLNWRDRGPFHKSSYKRFLLYEFVEPVLNYGSNEFVAVTNLYETGPRSCRIPIYVLSHDPPNEECMTCTSSWGIYALELGASWLSLLDKPYSKREVASVTMVP